MEFLFPSIFPHNLSVAMAKFQDEAYGSMLVLRSRILIMLDSNLKAHK